MNYVLRDYQERAVNKSVDYLTDKKKKEHGIVVLPTGSGKSLVIAEIAKRLDGSVLILQPSKEILEQNYEKFVSYGNVAGIYSASVGVKKIEHVTFATIGSIVNTNLFQSFNYVIIDECHYVNSKEGMYSRLIKQMENSRCLGLTATPYRLSTSSMGSMLKFLTRTRPRVFSNVVSVVQVKELLDRGYLANLKYYPIKGFDDSEIALNSTGADYDERSLRNYLRATKFDNSVLGVVERLMKVNRKGILVFTKFVDESYYIKQNIGDACAVVDSQTKKKDRERILREFKEGKIKVVCNVGVLTTGFDYPELDTVVLARPTRSLALYYQMVGRAIRPHANKECAWIVDMVNLVPSFGKVEDLHLDLSLGKYWQIKSNGRPLTNVLLNPTLNDAKLSLTSF
jgi:DNA repair protein RadD